MPERVTGSYGFLSGPRLATDQVMTYRMFFLGVGLCVTLLGSGCSDEATRDYEAALERWAAAQVEDYSVHVNVDCFCPREPREDAQVTVRAGEVTAALGLDRSSREHTVAIAPEDFLDWYTVDGMFRVIQVSLDAGQELDVVYDEDLGVPLRVLHDSWELDAGFLYQMQNFQEIPAP